MAELIQIAQLQESRWKERLLPGKTNKQTNQPRNKTPNKQKTPPESQPAKQPINQLSKTPKRLPDNNHTGPKRTEFNHIM